MISALRTMAISVACTIWASAAFAVVVSPFDTPLSAGDSTTGSVAANPFQNFATTSLSFQADGPLIASVSYTVDPFGTDLTGAPINSIGLSYSVNLGASVGLPLSAINVGVVNIGAGGVQIGLADRDSLTFFVTGLAGPSGNKVTFSVETAPVNPVPVAPAGLLMLTGLGALAVARKKTTNA